MAVQFFVLMRHYGASLRPLVFVLGFFAIILAPQFVYHLSQARWPSPEKTAEAADNPEQPLTTTASEEVWAHRDGHFLHPQRLFGEDAEPALTREARQIFPDFLDKAQAAKLTPQDWQGVRDLVVAGMKAGRPTGGLTEGIHMAGELLARHFPIRPDDVDELPNTLVLID